MKQVPRLNAVRVPLFEFNKLQRNTKSVPFSGVDIIWGLLNCVNADATDETN